ncbi:cellulose binding domain-containing protein, partial [Micromonospora sp. M51]|uniref:cellulose binding domain-containing protein n=1 Tax=Micromonospora sp. M51 TaxID=2824889 RepID=UPI001FFD7909
HNRRPTTPPPTTPPPAAGCAATYRVTGSWSGGFQAELTVSNTGSAPIAGWTLGWIFTDGQQVNQLWGGTHTQTGAAVTVRDSGWNGALAAGASTTAGFLGSGPAATRPRRPSPARVAERVIRVGTPDHHQTPVRRAA